MPSFLPLLLEAVAVGGIVTFDRGHITDHAGYVDRRRRTLFVNTDAPVADVVEGIAEGLRLLLEHTPDDEAEPPTIRPVLFLAHSVEQPEQPADGASEAAAAGLRVVG